MPVQKWEYQTVVGAPEADILSSLTGSLQEHIEHSGNEGWELVAAVAMAKYRDPRAPQCDGDWFKFYFKRPAENAGTPRARSL